MNNYLLFILCFIILIINYKSNNGKFSAPAVLLSLGFMMSSFIFMLNTNIWNYTISFRTVLVITFSIISFSLGAALGNRLKNGKQNVMSIRSEYETNETVFNPFISKSSLWMMLGISILSVVFRIISIYLTTGRMDFFTGAIGDYRYTDTSTRFDSVFSFLNPLIEFFSTVLIYYIINVFNSRNVKNRKVRLPICIILICLIYHSLSSARIDFVYIFIYFFVLYNTSRENKAVKKHNLKFFIVMVLALFIFARLFILLGYLTGKSQNQTSAFDNLSIYFGSSIGAFDIYIKQFDYSINNAFTQSLKGLMNFLRYFGLDFRYAADEHMGYLMYGDMTHNTNVYTGLKVLLHDFDYLGMQAVLFIEGVIFQMLHKRVYYRMANGNINTLIFYTYLSPFILLTSVADRVFGNLLTITSLIFAFYLFAFLYKIVKNTNSKESSK